VCKLKHQMNTGKQGTFEVIMSMRPSFQKFKDNRTLRPRHTVSPDDVAAGSAPMVRVFNSKSGNRSVTRGKCARIARNRGGGGVKEEIRGTEPSPGRAEARKSFSNLFDQAQGILDEWVVIWALPATTTMEIKGN